MTDIIDELNRVHRAVGDGQLGDTAARTVVLRRRYRAELADVWDACTNPDRIPRWFLPVTGDLRLGGRYQLVGNAGGEVVACEPPHRLRVTWEMGESVGPPSEVEVRLTAAPDGETDFELTHIAAVDPEFWDRFGPGAVGVGWDLGLLGLAQHVEGGGVIGPDAEAWQRSPAARECMTRSSAAWRAAHLESGADPAAAASAERNTTAFYTGVPAE